MLTVTGYFCSNLYSQTKNRNNIFLHSILVTKGVTKLTSATPTGGLCSLEMHRVTTPSPLLGKAFQKPSIIPCFLPSPLPAPSPREEAGGCKHYMLNWAYSQSLSYQGRHSRIFQSRIWNCCLALSATTCPTTSVIRTQISLSWIQYVTHFPWLPLLSFLTQ